MYDIKTKPKWARQRGTTLIEMSVVIAVILLLVGVLFIAVDGWKKSANRAACIVNIATLQKAVRSLENGSIDQLNAGTTVAWDMGSLNTAGYVATTNGPACPAGPSTAYYAQNTANVDAYGFPAVGSLAYTCANISTLTDHVPANFASW